MPRRSHLGFSDRVHQQTTQFIAGEIVKGRHGYEKALAEGNCEDAMMYLSNIAFYSGMGGFNRMAGHETTAEEAQAEKMTLLRGIYAMGQKLMATCDCASEVEPDPSSQRPVNGLGCSTRWR